MKCFHILTAWFLVLSHTNASAFVSLSPRIQPTHMFQRKLPLWSRLRGGEQVKVSPEQDDSNSQMKTIPMLSGITTFLAPWGKLYTQQLELHPIFTKSWTSGVLFAASDVIAQKMETSEKSLDWTRLLACSLVGLLYFGPTAHYWYNAIFWLFPGNSWASTLQKMLMGQIIFGPAFTAVFFASSLLQTGDFTLASWWDKIRRDLPAAFWAGAGFWPLVDLVSYTVVPVKWIPLFINFCQLIWTVYLSSVANKKAVINTNQ